jgi:predicted GIY-YIG superfamily endonuclease
MKRTGVYVAVNNDGDVYVGQSFDLDRRAKQHARGDNKGVLDTIVQYETEGCNPYASMSVEGAMIRFYQVQQEDGEAFELLNKGKKKHHSEVEWRYPENYGTL